MNKIRKNSQVIIVSGNHKGKRGKVSEVLGDSVVVEGLNMKHKTSRPDPQSGQAGGIVEKEAPIHASNVALVDPQTGKAARVGFKTLDDGRKVRIFKHSGETVPDEDKS